MLGILIIILSVSILITTWSISTIVGVWNLIYPTESEEEFPRVNYWLHLIPILGFVMGLYMIDKPLIRFEQVQQVKQLRKMRLPILKLCSLVLKILWRSP